MPLIKLTFPSATVNFKESLLITIQDKLLNPYKKPTDFWKKHAVF